MKNILFISILFACSVMCNGQESSAGKMPSASSYHHVAPTSGSSDAHAGIANALDGNYVIQLQIEQEGVNSLDLSVITARPNFEFQLTEPMINFRGTLLPQKEGQYLLEYSLSMAQPDPAKKPANKTQSNNQMLNSGLVSFILRSSLNYAPSQQIKETEDSKPHIILRASSWFSLNQPRTVMSTKKASVRIAVSQSPEQ